MKPRRIIRCKDLVRSFRAEDKLRSKTLIRCVQASRRRRCTLVLIALNDLLAHGRVINYGRQLAARGPADGCQSTVIFQLSATVTGISFLFLCAPVKRSDKTLDGVKATRLAKLSEPAEWQTLSSSFGRPLRFLSRDQELIGF